MTWEIALGIITLVGFLITIGNLVANNTKAMTKLSCAVDELIDYRKEQTAINKDTEDKLEDHEVRITVLEHK